MARAKKRAVGAASASKAEEVLVLDGNSTVIRSYSLEVHGENFRELAEEFAGKEEGREVVDAE